jgi:hypothetical protein
MVRVTSASGNERRKPADPSLRIMKTKKYRMKDIYQHPTPA